MIAALTILALATWNLRGLGKPSNAPTDKFKYERILKRALILGDCVRYGFDVVGLQETKCALYENERLPNGYRLILFEQEEGYHGGVGFLIAERICDFVISVERVSDRVCYLDLSLPLRGGGFKKIRIVNCYGYTSQRALESPRKVERYYDEVTSTYNVPAKWEAFVMGDMNAKLGRLTRDDEQHGLSAYIGNHGIGLRNPNGETMLNFMIRYDLLACNTAFQQTVMDWSESCELENQGNSTALRPAGLHLLQETLCRTATGLTILWRC